MTRSVAAIVMAVVLFGCSEKAREARQAAAALGQLAAGTGQMQANLEEMAKFQKERVEKGDTVAMPYAELQKMLPSSIDGYTASAEPEGSSQSMTGFSMSQAEQTWTAPAAADGTEPRVHVAIIDFGGTQAGYGMMAAPMMMTNFTQEDAHHRVGTLKMDLPYTSAWEEFNKDNKDAKVSAVTRYRYVITVEATGQSENQSKMVTDLVRDLARKFDGK